MLLGGRYAAELAALADEMGRRRDAGNLVGAAAAAPTPAIASVAPRTRSPIPKALRSRRIG